MFLKSNGMSFLGRVGGKGHGEEGQKSPFYRELLNGCCLIGLSLLCRGFEASIVPS